MTAEQLIRPAHKQTSLMIVDTPFINDLNEEATVMCDDKITKINYNVDGKQKSSLITPRYSGEKDNLGSVGQQNRLKGEHIENNYITNYCNYTYNNKQILTVDRSDVDTQPSQVIQAKTTRIDLCVDSGTTNVTDRLICYNCQNILVATPITESDKMQDIITLGQFQTLIKKTLNLRRFPKSQVKSTGLIIYPEKGNHRFWYFGVQQKVDNEEKVNWIPYLSGESVPLKAKQSIEVKEEYDEQEGSQSTIGQTGEKVNDIHKLNIGTIEDVFAFTFPMPRVINLPIKLVGEEFYLPIEYMGMVEALQKIIDHQKSINPNFSKYYAYITVDTSVSNHSLSILTNKTEHETIEKFQIYYGKNYQVFVKSTELPYFTVTFTTDKLNTIGNGINPLLSEKWTYQPCEVIER